MGQTPLFCVVFYSYYVGLFGSIKLKFSHCHIVLCVIFLCGDSLTPMCIGCVCLVHKVIFVRVVLWLGQDDCVGVYSTHLYIDRG